MRITENTKAVRRQYRVIISDSKFEGDASNTGVENTIEVVSNHLISWFAGTIGAGVARIVARQLPGQNDGLTGTRWRDAWVGVNRLIAIDAQWISSFNSRNGIIDIGAMTQCAIVTVLVVRHILTDPLYADGLSTSDLVISIPIRSTLGGRTR